MSRYDSRPTAINNHELYKQLLKDRGVRYIRQFQTPDLNHPSAEDIAELEIIGHIWQTGDRYYKLASKYYGDPTLWYVIAWYNQKPTESHMSMGEIVYIPLPLSKILDILDI